MREIMRCRRRYIVFRFEGDQDVGEAVAKICKELRADQAKIRPIFYDVGSGKGIIFCCHYLQDDFKKKIAESRSPIKIVGISGTIKTAKMKFGFS
ncbi:MAG: hypothetical protein ACUVQM_02325 [Candidatus Hadarchaeaceae archaeon]